MENKQLLQFIRGKFQEDPLQKKPGPAVTISREYGCPGFQLAENLASTLSRRQDTAGKVNEWHALGREIIENASQEIQLPPDLVEAVARNKPKGLISEMIDSLSPYRRPGDIEIKKTVASFVMAAARQGHVVIVGRGGSILTSSMENSLHISLNAPLSWRVKQVMELRQCTGECAEELISLIDRDRTYLRHYIAGESIDSYMFDLVINMERINLDTAEKIILTALEQKKIIKPVLLQ
ncbi:MAG: cytidylate kinase-like family protein [Spirochaetia bacterium]|nr:cytidylate kinase-like family protein [Spirochaetia bacterium]